MKQIEYKMNALRESILRYEELINEDLEKFRKLYSDIIVDILAPEVKSELSKGPVPESFLKELSARLKWLYDFEWEAYTEDLDVFYYEDKTIRDILDTIGEDIIKAYGLKIPQDKWKGEYREIMSTIASQIRVNSILGPVSMDVIQLILKAETDEDWKQLKNEFKECICDKGFLFRRIPLNETDEGYCKFELDLLVRRMVEEGKLEVFYKIDDK